MNIWIRVDETESDNSSQHGTCMASKIAGEWFGVSRGAALIIMKTLDLASSALDALEKAIKDLDDREQNGEIVKGFTVINLQFTYYHIHRVNENKMEQLIRILIFDYQAVIIVPAGNVDYDAGEDDYEQINDWPALFSLQQDLPIITVGAISIEDGKQPVWAKGGPALTVNAPGAQFCAFGEGDGQSFQYGTSMAAALASGLAADYMSRDYLRKYLHLDELQDLNRRSTVSVAEKIRNYMKEKSHPRQENDLECIWNGLYPDNPSLVEP